MADALLDPSRFLLLSSSGVRTKGCGKICDFESYLSNIIIEKS